MVPLVYSPKYNITAFGPEPGPGLEFRLQAAEKPPEGGTPTSGDPFLEPNLTASRLDHPLDAVGFGRVRHFPAVE
jgi:hypothetical protein